MTEEQQADMGFPHEEPAPKPTSATDALVERWFSTEIVGTAAAAEHWAHLRGAIDNLKRLLRNQV